MKALGLSRKDPIMHAHILVNNTDLMTGKRISPLLDNKTTEEFFYRCQDIAKEMGLTYMEIDENGMNHVIPGRPRSERARYDADLRRALEELDPRSPARASREELAWSREHPGLPFPGSLETPLIFDRDNRPNIEKNRRRGSFAEVSYSAGTRRYSYSWMQDLRNRIDIAYALSASVPQFEALCEKVGVRIERAKGGDYMYVHPSADTRRARGAKLGRAYTRDTVKRRLAQRYSEAMREPLSRRRAHEDMGGVIRSIQTIGWLDKGSKVKVADIALVMKFNRDHGIECYEDYARLVGSGAVAAADAAVIEGVAREAHMFDVPSRFVDDVQWMEELDRAARRTIRGAGGEKPGRATSILHGAEPSRTGAGRAREIEREGGDRS